MKDLFKKIFGKETDVKTTNNSNIKADTKPVKPKKTQKKTTKPKKVLTAKELATKNKQSYVSVVKVSLNEGNPSAGSFELDWNDLFIQELRTAGYPGKNDADVVDLWFQDICRSVVAETYEQETAQSPSRYIRSQHLGGKTEIS